MEKLAIDREISKEFLQSIGLFPVQFLEKLVIGPKISKKFLQSIAVFFVQFQGTSDRSVQIFKGIVRSVQLKGYYYSICGKVAIDLIFNKEKWDRS